jgi:hypothetical protein
MHQSVGSSATPYLVVQASANNNKNSELLAWLSQAIRRVEASPGWGDNIRV